MRIHVKLFAILRDAAGTADVHLDMPNGASVADAAVGLGEKFAALRPYLSRVAYAVDRAYVKQDHVLREGNELALIPPVSGGCP